MKKLYWRGVLTNGKTVRQIEIPKELIDILAQNSISYGYLFRDYHVLDITDLRYELGLTRQNLTFLKAPLRRKIKSYTYDLEKFLDICDQRRLNIKTGLFEYMKKKNKGN